MTDRPRTNGSLLRQALPPIVLAPFALGGLVNADFGGRAIAGTALLVAAVGLICALPPVGEILRRGPSLHAAIFGIFLGAAIFGQISRASTASFPFVSWRMFSGGTGATTARYLTIEGVRADGTRFPLAGEALFPTLRHHRFYAMVSMWRSRAGGSRKDEEIYRQILSSIRTAHNRAHPEDPIDRVEVTPFERPLDPARDTTP